MSEWGLILTESFDGRANKKSNLQLDPSVVYAIHVKEHQYSDFPHQVHFNDKRIAIDETSKLKVN